MKKRNIGIRRVYDGSYLSIDYPGGDVPDNLGVCTDVVIRSYRNALNVDLQVEVHEDMKANFGKYPDTWNLRRADRNIDHRRVPNLRIFFTRKGKSFKVTTDGKSLLPGDLVTYHLLENGSLPHIAIVTDRIGDSGNPMIVHNIGSGPELEDRLFEFKMTGHYRYYGK